MTADVWWQQQEIAIADKARREPIGMVFQRLQGTGDLLRDLYLCRVPVGCRSDFLAGGLHCSHGVLGTGVGHRNPDERHRLRLESGSQPLRRTRRSRLTP